jgi:hypothetical protein
MKRIMISCVALAALAAPAFAGGATVEVKDQGTQVDLGTNPISYYSSRLTGNGGNIGGNGSCNAGCLTPDQTISPGSRADIVQGLLATVGKGSGK